MVAGRHQRSEPPRIDTVSLALRRHLQAVDGSVAAAEAATATVRVLRRRRNLEPQAPPPWRTPKREAAQRKQENKKPRGSRQVCGRCRLNMAEWPYCGLSGDPHALEEAETTATAQ
ncbi:hypothetical protein DQ04_10991020 [Trypanosoma grayi]|uniref:hypothetical protein n=1 Tax=Trypanosoma grayi TaxID=71804 RepID=UPI0004F407EF|nr:hypothetical protein DQ04_10991020 [Trypanosoma grayi]KEG07080.1 hypothetical protein DQ04_10991020 [Trypanosoma grayi]